MSVENERSVTGFSIGAIALVGLIGCTQESVLLEVSSIQMTPAGGIAKSPDKGRASLTFEEGAVDKTTEITITVKRDLQKPDLVTPIYELGPDGLTFDAPVTLKLEVGDVNPSGNLIIANIDHAQPIALGDSTYDAVNKTITATLEHFSSYGGFDLQACQVAVDCDSNHLCIQGVCVQCANGGCNQACAADSECAPGELCVQGACVPCQGANCSLPCNAAADCPPAQACLNGVCGTPPTPACGNGILEGMEACDDGNSADGDGCSANCTLETQQCANSQDCDPNETCVNSICVPCQGGACTGTCGDGNLDQGEQCDDGNSADGDGCSANCTIEQQCNSGQGCNPNETCVNGICVPCQGGACPACGDGNLDSGEQCDDGNTQDGDGCSANCTLEGNACQTPLDCNPDETCVNGICAPCQGGVCPGTCGDGNLDQGEQCDDGNMVDGDGCSANCTIENPPACGDGNLDQGEQCDDGNMVDGDGCSANCTIENPPMCGDGNLDQGEQCDDGNTLPGDGCNMQCMIECPNGSCTPCQGAADCVQGQEYCSPNFVCVACSGGMCPTCGDGFQDPQEQCDDGNVLPGDGCDSLCMIEAQACQADQDCPPGQFCVSSVCQ